MVFGLLLVVIGVYFVWQNSGLQEPVVTITTIFVNGKQLSAPFPLHQMMINIGLILCVVGAAWLLTYLPNMRKIYYNSKFAEKRRKARITFGR